METTAEARAFFREQLSEARARIRERISYGPEPDQPDYVALDAVMGDVESRLVAGVTDIHEAASALVFSDWWLTEPVGARRQEEVEVN